MRWSTSLFEFARGLLNKIMGSPFCATPVVERWA